MRRPALLLLLLTSCGGRAAQAGSSSTGGELASSGGAEASTGAAGSFGQVAGGDFGDGGATSAGASNGVGEAGAAPLSIIRSGTRTCDDERYCFGLACYAPDVADPQTKVCVSSCETDEQCWPDEICLQSPELQPGCYRVCQSPSDCYYGFDCFDFTKQQQALVCFPTRWAALWRAHSY